MSSKVEKGVTESDLHRKESFQKVENGSAVELNLRVQPNIYIRQKFWLFYAKIATRPNYDHVLRCCVVYGGMAKVVFINVYCTALALLIITLIGSTLVT